MTPLWVGLDVSGGEVLPADLQQARDVDLSPHGAERVHVGRDLVAFSLTEDDPGCGTSAPVKCASNGAATGVNPVFVVDCRGLV